MLGWHLGTPAMSTILYYVSIVLAVNWPTSSVRNTAAALRGDPRSTNTAELLRAQKRTQTTLNKPI